MIILLLRKKQVTTALVVSSLSCWPDCLRLDVASTPASGYIGPGRDAASSPGPTFFSIFPFPLFLSTFFHPSSISARGGSDVGGGRVGLVVTLGPARLEYEYMRVGVGKVSRSVPNSQPKKPGALGGLLKTNSRAVALISRAI
jgi:hypothetical protein